MRLRSMPGSIRATWYCLKQDPRVARSFHDFHRCQDAVLLSQYCCDARLWDHAAFKRLTNKTQKKETPGAAKARRAMAVSTKQVFGNTTKRSFDPTAPTIAVIAWSTLSACAPTKPTSSPDPSNFARPLSPPPHAVARQAPRARHRTPSRAQH